MCGLYLHDGLHSCHMTGRLDKRMNEQMYLIKWTVSVYVNAEVLVTDLEYVCSLQALIYGKESYLSLR